LLQVPLLNQGDSLLFLGCVLYQAGCFRLLWGWISARNWRGA